MLVAIEHRMTEDHIVKVTPIEERYSFASAEECQSKLKEIKATTNITTGLRCVPDGNSN